ncbi:MAG TPA: hypothetical protein VNJ51_00705 [Candidatus Dormibacteraeota bacterium]|nr:hypothetical protein [Candidatus Dormibacteraeota bacterium]
MRVIVMTAMLSVLFSTPAFAADAPPFAVLQISTNNGLRSATVRVAPGRKGIITVVPGATFGSRFVTKIDEDAVWLSDGTKVDVDPQLSNPYVHRYDALLHAGDQASDEGDS